MMKHSESLLSSFVIVDVSDGLCQFERENSKRQDMHSIAIAEFSRMILTQFLNNLSPFYVKIDTIRT